MFDLFDRLYSMIREARLPDVQAAIKARVKPSMDLPTSTLTGEDEWYKFLILNDGSVIPVECTHLETISGGIHQTEEEEEKNPFRRMEERDLYQDSGGVEGRIDVYRTTVSIYYEKKLTRAQINSILDLYRRYKGPKELVVDGPKDKFITTIDSEDRLEAVLEFGKEMAMAERYDFDLMDRLFGVKKEDERTGY